MLWRGNRLLRELSVLGCLCLVLACRRESKPDPAPTHARPLRLWIAGDVQHSESDQPLLEGIELGGALGIVNLEGPIGRVNGTQRTPNGWRLENAPNVVSRLRAAGVGVVSLANNHALDLDAAGLERTQRLLSQAGIRSASHGQPLVFEREGVQLSLLALDLARVPPQELRPLLARAARHGAELLLSLHTSTPPSYLPDPALEHAVDVALSLSPRLIFVHGSHRPARVERRGNSIVAWGLGNLVFDCECSDEPEALLLHLEWSRNTPVKARLLPVAVGRNGQPARRAGELKSMQALLGSLRSSPMTLENGWLVF